MRAALVVTMLCLGACHDEERRFSDPGTGHRDPFSDNAWGISEGKRLFRWYNCAGCHSNGGGGMGPALMDERWVYGSDPEPVFESIMKGRPNGMPAFADKLPEAEAWKLVAYVRNLAGLTTRAASSSRGDSLAAHPADTRLPRQRPVPR